MAIPKEIDPKTYIISLDFATKIKRNIGDIDFVFRNSFFIVMARKPI